MDSPTKGKVLVVLSADIKAIGMRELERVPIRRPKHQDNLLSTSASPPAKLHVLTHQARNDLNRTLP